MTSKYTLSFEILMNLLLLLSRFSRVRLCATPETVAHEGPPAPRPWDSPGKNTEFASSFISLQIPIDLPSMMQFKQ